MNIQDIWEKALKKTEIIRPRVRPLHTYAATHVPYISLAESSVNAGDTVVRRGEVTVEKPSIVLPFNMPQFEGFAFDDDPQAGDETMRTFFLMRGISFPSLKYNNKTTSLEVHEGSLSKAIGHYSSVLQQSEDVHTGLVAGPEDCWQFSVILFVCGEIGRSADGDIRRLLDDWGRKDLS